MTHIEKLHLEAIDNNICSESNYSRILGKNEAASKSAEITEQIACGFAEWVSKYDWVFMADRNYWVNDDSRLHPRSTKELLQLWKERKTKTLYYE